MESGIAWDALEFPESTGCFGTFGEPTQTLSNLGFYTGFYKFFQCYFVDLLSIRGLLRLWLWGSDAPFQLLVAEWNVSRASHSSLSSSNCQCSESFKWLDGLTFCRVGCTKKHECNK